MGYNTAFDGQFLFAEGKSLTAPWIAYLTRFARIRHVQLVASKLASRPDPLRIAVGLPLGEDGCFFTGDLTRMDAPELDRDSLSDSVPSFNCHWEPTAEGDGIQWRPMCDKTYESQKWLQFFQDNFFERIGFELTGHAFYWGDDVHDKGVLYVEQLSHGERRVVTVKKLPVLDMKNVFGAAARGALFEIQSPKAADWFGEPMKSLIGKPADWRGAAAGPAPWDLLRIHPADPGFQMPIMEQLVRAKFGFDMTPLHLALTFNRMDMAGFLLQLGGLEQLWMEFENGLGRIYDPTCCSSTLKLLALAGYPRRYAYDQHDKICVFQRASIMRHLPNPLSCAAACPASKKHVLSAMLRCSVEHRNPECIRWALAAGAPMEAADKTWDRMDDQCRAAVRKARQDKRMFALLALNRAWSQQLLAATRLRQEEGGQQDIGRDIKEIIFELSGL